jgi:tetratricopeptide (TPR) repeat protein
MFAAMAPILAWADPTGWLPTPSPSGLYTPGLVLHEQSGVPWLWDCFGPEVPPLIPTPECRDVLLWARENGRDLGEYSVIQEVQVETSGGEPVAVAYRLFPLEQVPLWSPPAVEMTLDRFLWQESYLSNGVYCGLAGETRRKAIARLTAKLPAASPGEQAELTLRLADLYFQEASGLALRERVSGSPFRGSHLWLQRAVELYQPLVRDHPRYERIDHALLFLGEALSDLGREDEAVSALQQLVRDCPESEYVDWAWLRLGELLKETDLPGALEAYRRASRHLTSPHHSYALYRIAWAQHRAGDRDRAVATRERLLAHLDGLEPQVCHLSVRAAALALF